MIQVRTLLINIIENLFLEKGLFCTTVAREEYDELQGTYGKGVNSEKGTELGSIHRAAFMSRDLGGKQSHAFPQKTIKMN